MAIIITANQIYDIAENKKIIDNIIKGVNIDEQQFVLTSADTVWQETSPANVVISKTPRRYYSKWSPVIGYTDQRAVYDVYLAEIIREQESTKQIIDETDSAQLNLTTTYEDNTGVDFPYVPVTKLVNIPKDYTLNLYNQVFSDIANKEIHTMDELYEYASEQFQYAKYDFQYEFGQPFSLKIQYVHKIVVSWQDSESSPIVEYGFAQLSNSTFSVFSTGYGTTGLSKQYGNSPYYSADTNELLQDKTIISNQKISEYLSNDIINEWSKGKETATLKCSIGEYYDENNNLVISTKNNDLPMMFNIRDLVIPYIPIARGGTEPMSIKLDGTPKVFQVTQVRPYFDGACWQEIMLQEYTGDNPSANKA